ncbi:uncharacterized protein EURHEDRAFT_457605 [Aspergillus ruber CBS 135680]|uniref:Zn(II)2Cys6 transcription factor n=1 Tax=Aspergillus ruber (strain CBS 135680) TaxID=1388766 RepID=A0A017SDR9_ASPRC|nr:Zn(II)2Cys6 transcription factor [Aspergillus ruber CBS 135680]EYE94390.1 Zn(II)2Cys6 transcription factor [Aspergillus ruber CBS 135680]
MDCGSAGTTAGIDPKILENWQSDSAFSIASWEHPPEWDTSQDSSQADAADLVDLGALQGSFGKRHSNAPPLMGQGVHHHPSNQDSTSTSTSTSPEKFSVPDGAVEGTVSSNTVSPRTLPSSADDNFHLDESWPQFQLFNPITAAMPIEPQSMMYPYAKEPTAPNNTVIVDDGVGDLSNGQGFSSPEFQSEQFMPFSNVPSTFPLATEPWPETNPAVPENTHLPQPQMPLMESQLASKEMGPVRDFHGSMRSLESRWLDSIEAQLPADMSASSGFSMVPLDSSVQGQDRFQYNSESSSVSDDVPGVHESFSATSEEIPTFAERQLDDESQQTTAFMVSETPADSYIVTGPSRSRASSGAQRPSNSRTPLALQSVATVRKRKPRGSNMSIDQSLPKPLQIVQEDGQGGSVASADFVSPPRGARRKGPLSMAGRANAGMRRKNKDTCVQCRLNKRKCDGHSPCDACRPTLHEQPCARACFANIVEYGTCNYISQRAINHPTMDRSGRVRLEIPSEFDLNSLLSFLGERQGRFNIRASQAWGSLYVLDLGETYRFLKSLSEYNGNNRSSFLEFIDRRIVESKDKSKNWLTCVRDCDPINSVYSLLSQWNNMPSRAAYSFVPLDPTDQERPMDIHNPEDRREILLAAQLSRIFCRMLEVEGFRKLERDFYNIKWKQISHETHLRFLSELGHILLSLRWRVSWWKRLGDGGREPDPSKQHYVDRVELLCRILYVYYTCVLAKLPSWSTSDVPKGTWSTYADSENAVWDDFPLDPSDSGFHNWMAQGSELIEQAGVPNKISKLR